MGDCFVPRNDISFGLLEKTFLDSYKTILETPGNRELLPGCVRKILLRIYTKGCQN
jgi:hypothetical protein